MGDFKLVGNELINSKRTALVVIDLQNGIVNSNSLRHCGVEVVEKACNLIILSGRGHASC